MNSISYIVLAATLTILFLARRNRHRGRLPPGPKQLPILGNLLNFPTKRAWLTFTEWKEQYGDIIYLNVLGLETIILNSLKVNTELLDKRSRIYSSRPRFTMINEVMGWSFGMGTMPYSDRWRLTRRFFHQHFNEHVVHVYKPIHERSVHTFCRNLLHSPDQFREHVRLLFAENILEAVYGIEVHDRDNIFVKTAEDAMHAFGPAMTPGRFLVDVLPFLQYIPSWIPGTGFKKFAADVRPTIMATRDLTAAFVQKQMKEGTAHPSMLSSLLSSRSESFDATISNEVHVEGEAEDAAKNSAAAAYTGGADTTNSTTMAMFLALANHPECQKAAQEELDAVLGQGRLPNFEDKSELPYINAVVKELLRWHIVGPLGLPHAVIEDDEYMGYLIPKGAQVISNIWAILRDENIYPNAYSFDPSRWLVETPNGKKINDAIPHPDIATFGFGRRICPGRYFAENSLFITVATVLSCFDIKPLNSAKHIDEEFTDVGLVFPAPFEVSIEPRSSKASKLIEETAIQDATEGGHLDPNGSR